MSESENPILHIGGTVSTEDLERALRDQGMRDLLRYTGILLAYMLFLNLAFNFSDLTSGKTAAGAWVSGLLDGFLYDSVSRTLIIGFLCLYALYLLLIRPGRAGKRARELDPEGMPVTCDFYEDRVEINVSASSSDRTIRLQYADVKRRIRETRFIFRLTTGQRNKIGLFKTIMTEEEIGRVRELLTARCPQRRARK